EGVGETIGEDSAPLVLAAVDYYFPIYRTANTYPFLLKEGIPGNPEGRRPEELHAQAWKLVEPLFREEQETALARYREMAGTGRTSQEIEEVADAARYGRVDVLFLRADVAGEDVPPRSGPRPAPVPLLAAGDGDSTGNRETTSAPAAHSIPAARVGDLTSFERESLLETAAAETLLRGGSVFALDARELPDESSPVAAILRF
ncbi:MAG: hypothetical protein M3198_02480, partial [Actinomycetota bacterium]|nr:hypothetical protein [Actinomycetota bacterium]